MFMSWRSLGKHDTYSQYAYHVRPLKRGSPILLSWRRLLKWTLDGMSWSVLEAMFQYAGRGFTQYGILKMLVSQNSKSHSVWWMQQISQSQNLYHFVHFPMLFWMKNVTNIILSKLACLSMTFILPNNTEQEKIWTNKLILAGTWLGNGIGLLDVALPLVPVCDDTRSLVIHCIFSSSWITYGRFYQRSRYRLNSFSLDWK